MKGKVEHSSCEGSGLQWNERDGVTTTTLLLLLLLLLLLMLML